VKAWQAEHGYTFPALVGLSAQAVEKDYQVIATPTHYLLDATGRILSSHSGFQPGDEKGLEEEVRAAIGIAAQGH